MTSPRLVLAASPAGDYRIRQFLDVRGGAAGLIERPPETRWASFGLRTLDSVHLVNSEYWEVRSADRKIVHLYSDGTLIFRAVGDGDYLCWPRGDQELARAARVNPVVVAESAVSFARVYQALMPMFVEPPRMIQFTVGVRDAIFEGRHLSLPAGGIKTIAWHAGERGNLVREVNPEAAFMATDEEVTTTPDSVAYEIVKHFYSFFDHEPVAVPFVAKQGEKMLIDIKLFDA